jgi:PAS domain-containing protein
MPMSFQLTFREFLDAMPTPAYLFDPERKHFVATNLSFCNLVGYSMLHDGVAFWAALSLWMGGLRAKELPNKGSEICQFVHVSERGSRLYRKGWRFVTLSQASRNATLENYAPMSRRDGSLARPHGRHGDERSLRGLDGMLRGS